MELHYCDMLSYCVKESLDKHPFFDTNTVQHLPVEEGYLPVSTRYIIVKDGNGKMYKVTVEEVNES